MVRAKFNYPDLDVSDSPLVSPTPLTSIGGIPGSAIAEKIFNDPDSWEENDADSADVLDDPLTWLTDEIGKFKANSAGVHGAFDITVHDTTKSDLTSIADGMEFATGLKGIGRTNMRPISISSFFESDEDIQAQLSKILHSGGIPHHVRPLSSTPSTATSCNTPLHVNTATVANSTEDGPSPVAIYSGSTTLSFLEWYGISTDIDQKPRNWVNPARRGMQASILPPGLDSPTSPIPIPSRPKPSTPRLNTNFEVLSRSYAPSPSPTSPKLNSNSSSRSSSHSRSRSHTGTPGRTSRRRRLPSIPPDPSAGPLSFLQTQVHSPSSLPLPPPPPRSSTTPSSSLPTSVFLSSSPQLSTPRPLSAARSPLVGPAGPRTRASQSRMNGQNITSRSTSLGHRPPVLRF